MKNIFIIGSKGIPANYGGFETFVDKLVLYQKSKDIKYHVSCLSNENSEFEYNGARCFNINVPNIGAAKAVYYDLLALKQSISYIKKNKIENAIIYILACRIGPFMWLYKRILRKCGIEVFVNPDGHEWKRGKWNFIIRKYWKISEKLMVKNADFLICDSKNIEKYIKENYKKYNPQTTFIAYGADVNLKTTDKINTKLEIWYKEKNITDGEYYLVVGRFVPENNYEIMIKEFMKSKTKKDFVLITNVEKNKFYQQLKEKTNFDKDNRIKFVGTVYDRELLTCIRKNAFAYLHGHEVGGTNPSLLEALATTNLNLLLDVGFNREVGEEVAVYFSKKDGDLTRLIETVDKFSLETMEEFGKRAKGRIADEYSWDKIVNNYEALFLSNR